MGVALCGFTKRRQNAAGGENDISKACRLGRGSNGGRCSHVGRSRHECTGARPLEDAERVRQQPAASRHRRRALRENIDRVSGGKFEIKFYEPGRPGAGARMLRRRLQRLGRGLLDHPRLSYRQVSRRSHSSPRCRSARSYGEFFAWKMFGGGNELKNEIYGKHNLYSLDCYAIGPETSGWFRSRSPRSRISRA